MNGRAAKNLAHQLAGGIRDRFGNLMKKYHAAYEKGQKRPSIQKIKKMMDDFGYNP